MHSYLEEAASTYGLAPRCDSADFGRHIYRELNGEADHLANKYCYTVDFHIPAPKYTYYRLLFDGSVSKSGCGGGWVLKGSHRVDKDMPEEWSNVARVSFPMPRHSTITTCELEACVWGVAFTMLLIRNADAASDNLKQWAPWHIPNIRTLKLAKLV